jgi:hypothetical protein
MRSFNPSDDYLFSQHMASEGMENQLKSFINALILEIIFISLNYLN